MESKLKHRAYSLRHLISKFIQTIEKRLNQRYSAMKPEEKKHFHFFETYLKIDAMVCSVQSKFIPAHTNYRFVK